MIESAMKVLVIGATGLTGQHAIRRLLAAGDSVTALVRNPGSAGAMPPGVSLAQGEARDATSLEKAVAGHDAVLSTFGPRAMKKDDLQEVFMRNLVGAMEKTGVKRLSNLSAWGAGDSYDALNLIGKIFERVVLRELFADKNRGEAFLFASSLDYVNVRPNKLSNGAARGGVKASLDPRELRGWPFMTRDDVAGFMVEQLRSAAWIRKSPLIGY